MLANFLPQTGFDYQKVREIYEEALLKVGLHFSEGSIIWDAYIKFEQDYLMVLNNTKNIDENIM